MSDDIHAETSALQQRGRMPRLISRLYRGAVPSARAAVLTTLMRPLGSLGLAAVASGAFAGFAARRRGAQVEVGAEEASRYTSDQVLELARFVEQVDADVFQQVLGSVVDSPAGFTAFGVAAALLALRWYRRRGGG